jgi:transporter family protein
VDPMKDSPGLHLKTYVFILLMVLFNPLGNVLLSTGMKGIGSAKNWVPGELFHILVSIITSGYIWLGIAGLPAFFVAYMLVLTWADCSYVQPASSFS